MKRWNLEFAVAPSPCDLQNMGFRCQWAIVLSSNKDVFTLFNITGGVT